MERTECRRLVDRRMHDGVLGQDDVDRVEQTFVLDDARIDHRRQLRHRITTAVGKRVPDAHQLRAVIGAGTVDRSAERRVGKACVSTCRYRGPPTPYKNKNSYYNSTTH